MCNVQATVFTSVRVVGENWLLGLETGVFHLQTAFAQVTHNGSS